MVGAGVPVEFLRLYYDQPQRGGVVAARLLLVLTASVLRNGALGHRLFSPIEASLYCDGARVPFDAYTVIYASSIEDIGLGFRPTYRARERPGHVHVFAGPIGAREFVRCLPAIKRGRPTGSPAVYDALARTVCVEFPRPTFYMIDGDIMQPTTSLTVERGPVVRMIRR